MIMAHTIEEIKNKYKKGGYKLLTDYEKLMLLLSYSEKGDNLQKSVDKIISSYGNIHNAADLNVRFLIKECGLSESSAVLLNLVSQINRRTEIEYAKKNKLNSFENAERYFSAYLKGCTTETIAVAATDKSYKIVASSILTCGGFSEVHVKIRSIMEFILKNKCKYLFIAHSHPNGEPEPSPSDIKATKDIKEAVESIGVTLVDHIITGKHSAASIRQSNDNLLTKLNDYHLIQEEFFNGKC